MKSVSEKVLCVKIDKYYFKDHKGRTYKYLQFYRRKLCKTESSYNYENLKPKYCFRHKKEDMVNVKRGHKLCLKCKYKKYSLILKYDFLQKPFKSKKLYYKKWAIVLDCDKTVL